MTETDWLACDHPRRMLGFLRGKASDRKVRLLACACCRRIWPLFRGQERTRDIVFVSEQYADGRVTKQQLKLARRTAYRSEAATALTDAYSTAAEASIRTEDEVRWLA